NTQSQARRIKADNVFPCRSVAEIAPANSGSTTMSLLSATPGSTISLCFSLGVVSLYWITDFIDETFAGRQSALNSIAAPSLIGDPHDCANTSLGSSLTSIGTIADQYNV